jgi:hypothetical protein
MNRATVICLVEGQSENLFVERLLAPHLSGQHGVDLKVPIVTTRTDHRSGQRHKGGGHTFQHYVTDLKNHFFQYKRQKNAWFTTLVDVYGLPEDFPQKEKGFAITDPRERVKFLEQALTEKMRQEVGDEFPTHFIPHLMLHELETLLFVNIDRLCLIFPDKQKEIEAIKHDVRSFGDDVELINQTREGAPSKRIAKWLRSYGKYKASGAGGMVGVLERIGLMNLREACPHFGAWLTRLEQLGNKGDDT